MFIDNHFFIHDQSLTNDTRLYLRNSKIHFFYYLNLTTNVIYSCLYSLPHFISYRRKIQIHILTNNQIAQTKTKINR